MIKKKNDSAKTGTVQNLSKQNTEEESLDESNDNIGLEKEQIEQLENQLKRALADYQNLEKRTGEEKREWVLSGNRGLISKLLPVLDNLFLASKHMDDEGLNLSIRKFIDVLREEGVEKIETVGHDFDPNTMECVSVQEGEAEKILEEVRPGFIMNDKVIRPAQVIVGGSLKN